MTTTQTLVQEGWKAAASLAIPVAQWLWNKYASSGSQAARLRRRIADLHAEREAFKKYHGVAKAGVALADLTAELDACMEQLVAAGRALRNGVAAVIEGRSLISRSLLLYIPLRPLGWVAHTLFYLSATFAVLVMIAAAYAHDLDSSEKMLIAVLYTWCRWIDARPRSRAAAQLQAAMQQG
jgi:hypothetical protein